jgi:hypothetical protein
VSRSQGDRWEAVGRQAAFDRGRGRAQLRQDLAQRVPRGPAYVNVAIEAMLGEKIRLEDEGD